MNILCAMICTLSVRAPGRKAARKSRYRDAVLPLQVGFAVFSILKGVLRLEFRDLTAASCYQATLS